MSASARVLAFGALLLGLLFLGAIPCRAGQNDAFAGRLAINAISAVVVGDISTATREADEPAHAQTVGLRSVWWTWTPSSDHQAQLSLVGADEEPVALAIYTGDVLGQLIPVASAQNTANGANPATLAFAARAGTAYAICASLPADVLAERVVLSLNQPPLFNIAAEHRVGVGASVSLTLTALHAPTAYSISGLPPGLIFDPVNGRISGVPSAPGEHWLDLTAENAFGQGTARVRLEVVPPAPPSAGPPFLAPPRTIHGIIGQSLPFAPSLSSDGQTAYAASGLPSGINLHAGTGEISGIPASAGVFEATVTATNAFGSFSSPVTFVITASADAPILRGSAATELVLGESLALSINPSDTAATLSAAALPEGVSLDTASRRLVGTPTTAGLYQTEVTATNPAGTTTARFAILVHPAPVRPPEFTHNGLWVTELGVSSTLRLTATQNPATFSVEGLPSWASFDAATATLSARPATLDIFPIQVTATNARGSTRGVVHLYVGTATPSRFPSFSSGSPASISAPLSVAGTVGAPFSYIVPTSLGSPFFYSPFDAQPVVTVEGLPPGLTFFQNNAQITGTVNTAGDYPVTIRYFNNGDMLEAVVTLVFRPAATAPSPTTPADPASLLTAPLALSALVGASASLTLFTPSSDATFTVSALPPGLSFSSSTGRISGTPTSAGAYPLDLAAANSSGSAQARVVLQVGAAQRPEFSNYSPAGSATVGVSFNKSFYASNSPTSYARLGSLPPGLTFSTSNGSVNGTPTAMCTLSGTPTAMGTYSLTIRATNSAGTEEVPFTLIVRPAEPAAISFPAQLVLTEGVAASRTTSSSPSGASYVAIGLPPSLAMSTSGTLSGTPTTPGDYVVTINATRNSLTSSLRSTLRVLPASASSSAPVFTSPAGASAVLGAPFSFRLAASGSPTTFTADPLPPGLSLEPSTGLLSGTPTQTGDFATVCGASNLQGTTSSRLALRVLPAPTSAPTLILPTLAQLTLGDENARLDLQPGGFPASISAVGLPRGLTMDAAGVVQGVPRVPGVFSVTVTAANSVGTTSLTFDLAVRTSSTAPLPTLNSTIHGRVGRPFSLAVSYTLSSGILKEIEVLGLPVGLAFDAATQRITGTPFAAGTSDLDLLVRTASAGGYARVRLLVAPATAERPYFTSPSTALAIVGQPFTHQLAATGGVTVYGATSLPSWLSLNPATGVLSGTPTSSGDILFTVSANNAQGTRDARQNIAIRSASPTVPPLLLDTPGSLVTSRGEPFRQPLLFSANGTFVGVTGFPGSVSSGPPVALDYSTPLTASTGISSVTISTSGPGGTTSARVNFEIEAPSAPILGIQAPSAIRAQSSFYLSRALSNSLASAAFTSMGLPPGLSLSASGNLSGFPISTGDYLATITASAGANAATGFIQFSITSGSFSSPENSTPAPARDILLGEYVSFAPALPSLGFSSDLTYRAENLPPGLYFDPRRGLILGTPSAIGSYAVKVSVIPATNPFYGSSSLPDPLTTLLVVRAAPLTPTAFTSPAEYRGTLGIDFSARLAATHTPTRFTATGLPPGLTLNPVTGDVSGRPSSAGDYLVALTAANSTGSVPATVRFVVSPDTPLPLIGGQLHSVVKAGVNTSLSLGLANSSTATIATGLPPGLALSSSGTITGTTTTPGDYPVTITATNAGGTTSATVLIQVLPIDLPNLLWPGTDLTFDAGANVNALLLSRSSFGPAVNFSAIDLPSGLYLDAPPTSSIYLKGRLDTPGRYPIRLDLSGYGQTLSVPAIINVLAPAAPVVSSPAVLVVTAGQAFDYALSVSSSVRLDLPSLPAGVFFHSANRRLSGVIAASGVNEVPISATSLAGQTAMRLTLIARPAAPAAASSARPLLTSSAHLLAHVGAPVFHTLASANPDATFTVGSLPPGLRYDVAQRAILGIPLTPGRQPVVITARAGDMTESATLLVTIRPYETRLATLVPNTRIPSTGIAYVGVPYTESINTFTSSLASRSYAGLPPGLSTPTLGAIIGVPERAGLFPFTTSLTFGFSPPLVFACEFRIEDTPRSLALPVHAAQAELLPSATAAIAVAASQPANLAFSGLPAGLSYSAPQGRIVGQTTVSSGAYPVTITATNVHGSLTSRLDLLLRPALEVPRFTSASIASATRFETFAYSAVTRPAGTVFSATGLPAGLALDPATGRITGRPVETGDHTIQLTATNSAGSATLALRLRVATGLASEPTFVVPANSLWPIGTDRSLLLARPETTGISASSPPSGVAVDATARLLLGRLLSTGAETVSLASAAGAARPSLVGRNPLLSPPWFAQELEDIVVLAGRPARFPAIADGRPAPSLSWMLDGSARAAEPDGSLLIPSASPALDGASVVLRATNASGEITSRAATLSVRSVPVLGFAEWVVGRGLPSHQRGPLDAPTPGATPNLLAYAMDLAVGETFVPAPEFIALPTPVLRFTYSRAKYADTVVLAPQRSADLSTWGDEGIVTEKLSEDTYREIWRATVPANDPRVFLRLTATAISSP